MQIFVMLEHIAHSYRWALKGIGLKNGLLWTLRKATCNIPLKGTRHNNHDLVPASGHIACYKRLKLTKKVRKIVIFL
jgi:hypothetical protein